MENWELSFDDWLTTEPEYGKDTHFICEGDGCNYKFYPFDYVYCVDDLHLCSECALKWLDKQRRVVQSEECYD